MSNSESDTDSDIDESHFRYDAFENRKKYVSNNNELNIKEDDIFNKFSEAFSDDDNMFDKIFTDNNKYADSAEYKNKLRNKNINLCKVCSSESIHYDPDVGGVVCLACGEFNGKVINNNKDWQNYNKEKVNNLKGDDRCNNYVSRIMPNAGPKLILKGVHHNSLLGRVHKWSGATYKSKNMLKIYKYIETTCKEILTIKTIKDAFGVYQEIYSRRLFRGKIRKGVIAACVLYASKTNGEVVTEDELADKFEIERNTILDGYKRLLNILYGENILSTRIRPSEASDYINKFCDVLSVDAEHKSKISVLVANIKRQKLATENNPKTQVTSCIFLMSCIHNLGITKKDIAQCCKISEVTLYKCYTKLLENIDRIMDITTLSEEQNKNLEKLKAKRYKRRSHKKN